MHRHCAIFRTMLGPIGDDLLYVAGGTALLAGVGGFALPARPIPFHFGLLRTATLAVFLLMLGAFGVLIAAYVTSDFSVFSVYENSHTLKPLFYKVAASWGNHEGSMILWTLIASLFGAVLALRPALSSVFTARALGTQMLLVFCFIVFILLTSDPFALISPAPEEGMGLNPILQDPALAAHPPILYLGYVGFSLSFSFAVAGLLCGNISRDWAKALRVYALLAWAALTVGIALGSWWAYYELGWGGWWFWDPVENASFIPWLCGTALIHALVVLEKRGTLKAWTALLALTTFTLSLCGTFLVRSGAITSVHAFALDPGRGIFILLLIALAAGSGLLIFGLRAHRLQPEGSFNALSRESFLMLNTLFFFSGCATVFIGTLYPMALELFANTSISVGAPYYQQSFVPLMMPMVVLMGLAPYALWQKDSLQVLWPRLKTPLLMSGAILLVTYMFAQQAALRFYLGMTLAGWVFSTSLHEAYIRLRGQKKIDLRFQAMTLAHLGFAISLFGMVVSSHFSQETVGLYKPGDSFKLGGLTLTFEKVDHVTGANYLSDYAYLRIEDAKGRLGTVHPERRYYPVADRMLSDVGIYTNGFMNVYLALGEPQKNKKGKFSGWSLRAAIHPLAPWIWLGCGVMALGAVFGITARKNAAA